MAEERPSGGPQSGAQDAEPEEQGSANEERAPEAAQDDGDVEVTTEELENRLRRALADLDNLRKRFQRELSRERSAERAEVLAAWVPVVDNLDRALEHADGQADALVEGLRAVRDQAIQVFARFGYPRFEDVGRPFDPKRHEAVATAEGGEQPGTVLAAVRPGYGTDDDILRHGAVIVSSGSE